jgi:rod shape-determining protein MreD
VSSLNAGLAAFLALLLQVSVADRLVILDVRPDLTVLIVVILGLRRGPMAGTLAGFFVGFLQDLLVPATLGMNTLAKSILGNLSGRLGQNLALPSLPLYAPLFALAVLLHDIIYLLAYTKLDPGRFIRIFLVQSLPTALYTSLLGVAILIMAALLRGGILASRREVGGAR